jgi:anti-sigma regulatory factor (Ser/Thr protein kinase)
MFESPTVDVSAIEQVAVFGPPDGAGSVGLARDFTRKTLLDWGFRGAHDDVVLAVSELVTNASRHAYGPTALRLTGGRRHVRIEVSDGSVVKPVLRPAGTTGGWGLRLVERLASRWGVVVGGTGKVVWCELGG